MQGPPLRGCSMSSIFPPISRSLLVPWLTLNRLQMYRKKHGRAHCICVRGPASLRAVNTRVTKCRRAPLSVRSLLTCLLWYTPCTWGNKCNFVRIRNSGTQSLPCPYLTTP